MPADEGLQVAGLEDIGGDEVMLERFEAAPMSQPGVVGVEHVARLAVEFARECGGI